MKEFAYHGSSYVNGDLSEENADVIIDNGSIDDETKDIEDENEEAPGREVQDKTDGKRFVGRTFKRRGRLKDRCADTRTDRQTGRQTHKHAGGQASRQTDGQKKQPDSQTDSLRHVLYRQRHAMPMGTFQRNYPPFALLHNFNLSPEMSAR